VLSGFMPIVPIGWADSSRARGSQEAAAAWPLDDGMIYST